MADLSGKSVAINAVDFVEDAELTTPRDQLREAGAEVKVYSPDGSPIQAAEGDTEPTQKIDADGSFDDVVVEEVDVDGTLITSRNPGDLDAFVGALTDALSS